MLLCDNVNLTLLKLQGFFLWLFLGRYTMGEVNGFFAHLSIYISRWQGYFTIYVNCGGFSNTSCSTSLSLTEGSSLRGVCMCLHICILTLFLDKIQVFVILVYLED